MVAMFWPQTSIPMETINWLALVPATFIQFWAGRRFYAAAWRAGRHGGATMDTLVAVGTSAAWAYSVAVTLNPDWVHQAGLHPETYFDSSTIILGLILLGRWLEARAKTRASGAIRRLIGLQATSALLIEPGGDRSVPIEEIQPGRPAPGPAGRPGPGRRRRGRRRLGGRRVDADRRADAGGQDRRRRGLRRRR